MPSGRRKAIPPDSLMQLRQRLDRLPHKSPERAAQVVAVAELYGVSPTSVYRALHRFQQPHSAHRADYSKPRVLQQAELERYCELIAALKLQTTNKQGRHLSTKRTIELLEDYGAETVQGLIKAPKGVLRVPTINHYLSALRLDQPHLLRQPPAVRFQAEHSNDCWQFDLSPSDLKYIDRPDWIDPIKGEPTLMLFSVVDDRSGTAYQEYRCVYVEDAESALRFLFNAMASKADLGFPFQGRPKMIYLDNGPVAKSRVFQGVMQALDIEWQAHDGALEGQGRHRCAHHHRRHRLRGRTRHGGRDGSAAVGLFDDELYVEFDGERLGPYYPVSGPIPPSSLASKISWSSSTPNRPRSRRSSATRWTRCGPRRCVTRCSRPGCRSESRQLQIMWARDDEMQARAAECKHSCS